MTDHQRNLVAALLMMIAAGCGAFALYRMLQMWAAINRGLAAAKKLQELDKDASENQSP